MGTAEEELGRFLLATAVPGSERCCKNFGLFVTWGQRLDGEQTSKFVSHCEAGNKAKDRVYGPLNGHYESFSLSEAQTELRALSASTLPWATFSPSPATMPFVRVSASLPLATHSE